MIIDFITWVICLCTIYQILKVRQELRKDSEMSEIRLIMYHDLTNKIESLMKTGKFE